jgi:hypothetical protein
MCIAKSIHLHKISAIGIFPPFKNSFSIKLEGHLAGKCTNQDFITNELKIFNKQV